MKNNRFEDINSMKSKRILITGKGSYIGTSFKNWVGKFPERYQVEELDLVDGSWKNIDFSKYDTIFHVAGLAHADVGKVSDETKSLYYKVNTGLTVEVAEKAKSEGVSQFIFMSSAIVYGESGSLGKKRRITRDTIPTPANFYGDSKLQAELGIQPLQSEKFNVVILRPPMIYGKGSKGNYPTLSKFAQKLPVFPNVKNERSMLHCDNLCEFVKLMVDNNESGVFFPQNKEYANTSALVKMIAQSHGKQIYLTRVFNPFLSLLSKFNGLVNKAFGNFSYDMEMSEYVEEYRIRGLKESIKVTELLQSNEREL